MSMIKYPIFYFINSSISHFFFMSDPNFSFLINYSWPQKTSSPKNSHSFPCFLSSASLPSSLLFLSPKEPQSLNKPSISDPPPTVLSTSCNYSHGSWIYDPNWIPNNYDSSCKEIFKGWNCISGNKSNAKDIIK
ncbi:hypothetical protein OIU84_004471 [Salix udensis]|uniref:Trichome birefringence-like N-terminal domain-containing protein n=1 Tax=Salix udensis TaxID=889485 RepID=A0AAD6P478_9ROSI|nr:hypothetical protein OIU84_004471 [Salix udensis]